jgi:Ulp1 family protease
MQTFIANHQFNRAVNLPDSIVKKRDSFSFALISKQLGSGIESLSTLMDKKHYRRLISRFWLAEDPINFFHLLWRSKVEFKRAGVFVFDSYFFSSLENDIVNTRNKSVHLNTLNRAGRFYARLDIVKECKRLLFPIFLNSNHWAKGEIDYGATIVSYSDSLFNSVIPPAGFKNTILELLSAQYDYHASSMELAKNEWMAKWRFVVKVYSLNLTL